MFKNLREDIDAMIARDPAARNRFEVALLYPGFQAVLFYRISHAFWARGWRFIGRAISQVGRWLTGIEIHPGARIGRRFFIDHGMGVVVGETSEIGDDVTLYHGVTLGGVAPSVDSHSQREQKRHPTLEDGVIVGSGAQVLGPVTVGHGARIGANAVVTKNVPPCVTMVGIPARSVQASKTSAEDQRFVAYGTPTGDIPDPVARALDGLLNEVQILRARIHALEAQSEAGDGDGVERVAEGGRGEGDKSAAADSSTGKC
jgi:serine O-acetyltransferase